jgi:hypothetical protein
VTTAPLGPDDEVRVTRSPGDPYDGARGKIRRIHRATPTPVYEVELPGGIVLSFWAREVRPL